MGEQKSKEERGFLCPVGRFFCDMEKMVGMGSEFFDHLSRSRIEFLRAIRSLVDERIQAIEKRRGAHTGEKRTKIKVE